MHCMTLFVILLAHLCCSVTYGDICQIHSSNSLEYQNDNESEAISDKLMTCPQPEDPPEYTRCCTLKHDLENETVSDSSGVSVGRETLATCCAPGEEPILFYFISDRIALIIAVCITAVLLVITVIVIVCCFWSRCPLYMMCRVRYRQDDVIAYASKDDERTNLNEMPPEEKKGVTVYSPNAIKVTLKDDL